MIWPWSELKRLREQVAWYASRDDQRLFHIELYKNIALQAMRDRSACNKGIRRLKDRLRKQQEGEQHE